MTALLEVRGLYAGYGKTTVIRDLNLSVPEGGTVALLGPNGAGKTTTLRAITGSVKITAGHIRLGNVNITRLSTYQRAKRGVALIPEGRGIFPGLTVAENLAIAADSAQGVDPQWRRGQMALVEDMFPPMRERVRQRAGSLSGGEQQMLAMSRAFLSNPKVLLMDEISVGLAPLVVELLYDAVARLKDAGATIVLVEQYLTYALKFADVCYVMAKGSVSFIGEPCELQGDSAAAYL
jgi:branched-chain amino acid transport system ATP-binding protein